MKSADKMEIVKDERPHAHKAGVGHPGHSSALCESRK